MAKIDPASLDLIALLEVEALLKGLEDEELQKNPAFLEKVRKFLHQNKLETTPQTPGVLQIQQNMEDIPDFSKEDDLYN